MSADVDGQRLREDGTDADPLEGFVPAPIPGDAWQAMVNALNPSRLRVGPALVRTHALGCDVLVEAWWNRQGAQGSSRPGRSMRRLLLLCHRPALLFPPFELIRRTRTGDLLFGWAAGMTGAQRLSLPDHPEFAARYTLLTANPGSVRTILAHADITALLEAGDLCLCAEGSAVVVSRQVRPTPEAQARLVLEASLVCVGFIDDPEACRRAEEAAGGSYLNEAARTLVRSGGTMAGMLKGLAVSASAVEALRAEAPPRMRVDPSIERRAYRDNAWVLAAMALFVAGFLIPGILFLLFGAASGPERVIGVGFSLLGLGAAIGFSITLRYRLTRRRIVRRGRVIEASVIAIERTNIEINGDRLHQVVFRLACGPDAGADINADPDAGTVRLRLRPTELEHAQRALRDGTRTWILQDPASPARILWPPGWILETTGS